MERTSKGIIELKPDRMDLGEIKREGDGEVTADTLIIPWTSHFPVSKWDKSRQRWRVRGALRLSYSSQDDLKWSQHNANAPICASVVPVHVWGAAKIFRSWWIFMCWRLRWHTAVRRGEIKLNQGGGKRRDMRPFTRSAAQASSKPFQHRLK